MMHYFVVIEELLKIFNNYCNDFKKNLNLIYF